MIFKDRAAVPPPLSLTAAGGKGKKELGKAKVHYKTSKQSYPFTGYKGDDVIQQLQALFKTKCAYCESDYSAYGPVHVEHYRPKFGVTDCSAHRGYWWLANEWTNLLPACHDCNCERWHPTAKDAPEFDGCVRPAEQLYGKGNHFPLNGTPRASRPRQKYSNEDPLLIDPTRQDPRDHITWKVIGDRSFAAPAWNAGAAGNDPYGLTSIRVYGLNRPGLMNARTEHLAGIRIRVNRLRKRMARAASLTACDLAEALDELTEEIRELASLAREDKEYSAAIDAEFGEFFRSSIASLEVALKDLL
jgi:hypothetical protein